MALISALYHPFMEIIGMLLAAKVPTSEHAFLNAGLHDMQFGSDVRAWLSDRIKGMTHDQVAALRQAATQHGHAELVQMLGEAGACPACS
jgi:hypothetical protein